MKKQTDNHFTKMNKENNNNSTAVAEDNKTEDYTQLKKFTEIDLWNIHRMSKTSMSRRQQVWSY
jgi:hypothetical protein